MKTESQTPSPCTVAAIVRRECKRILADSNILLVLMLAPLAYLLIFGFEYCNKKVFDVPIVVIDHDQSALSRTIIRNLDAHESVKVIDVRTDDGELRHQFITELIAAAVVIPTNCERGLKRGEHVNVLMMVNSANIVIDDYAEVGVQTVLGTIGAGMSIEKMMKRGTPSFAARDNYQPIAMQGRVLFNPGLTYSDFILPLLFLLLLHQVIALGAGMSWANEFENSNADPLAPSLFHSWRFIAGKSLPYAAIAFAWLAIIVFGAHTWLGVPFNGNPSVLLMFGILFSVNALLFAALAGSLIKSKVGIVQMLLLYSMPALLLSGTVWPFSAMPAPIHWLALLFPSTHILAAYQRIALEGAGFVVLMPTFGWLVMLAAVMVALLRWVVSLSMG